MSEPVIYKGRGNPEMYDDFMDFINYVFGFNGNESDFKKLLPKLYKPEYDPAYNNYVVTENGKLKAAIGAYDSEFSVCGETLKCRGIGNVAVHPYSRSKGYMIDCMNLALRDMIADGVDFSMLGGQRQRYQHFGFDYTGQVYLLHVNHTNLRHNFRDVPFTELELKEVGEDDVELIQKMHDLHATRPMHAVRPTEQFLDIARSWRTSVRAILKNGEFRGYFVGDLQELTLVDPDDLYDVIRNYVRSFGSVTILVPAWDTRTYAAVAKICDGISIEHSEMYNIFNYKKFVSALLKLKASYEVLGDGELTLFIHGYAGDCRLRLCVRDNEVSVEDYAGDCDLELSHMEAMEFLFGIHSARWLSLTPSVRSWFPLPLYVEPADHV